MAKKSKAAGALFVDYLYAVLPEHLRPETLKNGHAFFGDLAESPEAALGDFIRQFGGEERLRRGAVDIWRIALPPGELQKDSVVWGKPKGKAVFAPTDADKADMELMQTISYNPQRPDKPKVVKYSADMIHSDSELAQKMEPATPAPQAGPSNDELVDNSHAENGASPVLDGDLHSPERANVNAMREALETQAEMEVGKPILEKQEEVQDADGTPNKEKAEGKSVEIEATPGKQIIINIASQRIRISEGSGIDSSKEGVVIPWDDPRAKEARESYPFVGGRTPQGMGWLAILLDDGTVTSMPKSRVSMVKQGEVEPIGGEDKGKITSGMGTGAFGGTDLEGPDFHAASWDYPAKKAAFIRQAARNSRITLAELKNAAHEFRNHARTAAISVSQGEDAQGFHMNVNLSGQEYVLRGEDARNFRKEYAAIPKPEKAVNALVEKYLWKLQPYDAKPKPLAPAKINQNAPVLRSGIPEWLREKEEEDAYAKRKAEPDYVSHRSSKQASDQMKCPWCGEQATRETREGTFKCPKCPWQQRKAAKLAADGEKADFWGYDNWVTGHVALLIDNSEAPYNRKRRVVRNAIKKGIGPKQLAGQFARLFADQLRESAELYEQNAENAREERGAYERQQLEGAEPASTGNKAQDVANKLFNMGYDMGMTSFWEEPMGEVDWEAIAEQALLEGKEEMEAAGESEPKAEEKPKDVNELDLSDRDKQLMKDMGIQSALSVPDQHQLRIAVDTLKMPDEMVGVMGGMDKRQALQVLAKHGLRWDDADYMAGGKGVKKATSQDSSKEASKASVARQAQQLIDLDNDIWDRLGIESGTQLSQDYQLSVRYHQEIAEALKKAGIRRVSKGALAILEDENYHALVEFLERLMRNRTAADSTKDGKKTMKQARESKCIGDDCGMPYDTDKPETRDPKTLKPFWQRYCPKHRAPAEPPVIVENKSAGEGRAKNETELEKEAGFNFFFPGQVLKEFYPEIQHEIVDYPNATNTPLGVQAPEMVGDGGAQQSLEQMIDQSLDGMGAVEAIQLPADVGEIEEVHVSADYSSTSPAGGMGIGRDGKPEVLEGAPLRKENDIRGMMFTDEFHQQYEGGPKFGALAFLNSKFAADKAEVEQFGMFLKKVMGEIAAAMNSAFKVTSRPLLDKVPGIGEVQLAQIEQPQGMASFNVVNTGSRVKYLLDKLTDSEIQDAINDAWAQAAVWHDGPKGGYVYEVFVRAESIDTDSMIMKYKFVAGTRE